MPRKRFEVLSSLPVRTAILDARGIIVSVNDAWRKFARANGFGDPSFGIG